jgi:hypothetical protein
MRWNIVVPGVLELAAGLFYLYSGILLVYVITMGALTIFLGIRTPTAPGVSADPSKGEEWRLIVDKAAMRASIYMIVFFDRKLVLKKLASSRTTIFSVLLLALAGLFLPDYLLGALAGAFGGYALQEYTTHRNRQRIIRENTMSAVGRGDFEFPYDQIREVRLEKNRILVGGKDLLARLAFSKNYAVSMLPTLKNLFHAKLKVGKSLVPDASDKKDE